MSLIRVVFPLPDAPTIAVTLPLGIVRLTLSIIVFSACGVVFEVYVFKVYALILFFHRGFQSLLSVLIIYVVYLVDALKTYLYILHGVRRNSSAVPLAS